MDLSLILQAILEKHKPLSIALKGFFMAKHIYSFKCR
jgi:hypothetical protein